MSGIRARQIGNTFAIPDDDLAKQCLAQIGEVYMFKGKPMKRRAMKTRHKDTDNFFVTVGVER
jgi:hypothetical protein